MWVRIPKNPFKYSDENKLGHYVEATMCLALEVPTAAKENPKLLANNFTVGTKLCDSNKLDHIWIISSFIDNPMHRQRFLKIKNSNSNIVKP